MPLEGKHAHLHPSDYRGVFSSSHTVREFVNAVERQAAKALKAGTLRPEDENTYKGDMLETLAEIFFRAFSYDPAVGLRDYVPVPIDQDFGVDGRGVNANGHATAVQVKYRSNATDEIFYADLARTYTSGMLQLRLDLDKPKTLFLLTTGKGAYYTATKVLGDRLVVIGRKLIGYYVDNNLGFWDYARAEIDCTLAVPPLPSPPPPAPTITFDI